MIPIWKLKREAHRVAQHLLAIPLLAYEPLVQAFYDRNLEKNLVVHQGTRALGSKLAIFLVYQPGGLSESTYHTIDHLIESEFDPIVVSNCPLLELDVERLRLKTALVVQRRNFGYDFGGYRDAILLIKKLQTSCEQILFLNDSVWFPVFDNDRMLRDMSDSDSSYIGTQAFGEWRGDQFDGFFGSYCFLIKKPLLYGEQFDSFWKNYRLSSSKEIVLRRGERSFSRAMLRASQKSVAFFSHERFNSILNQMNAIETHQALQDLIAWDQDVINRKLDLLGAQIRDAQWADEARDLISSLARSKNFIGSSPIVSLTRLGFPMIKKNNEMLYKLARESIIAAIDSGRVSGMNPIVERELRKKSTSQLMG